jgi:segregation and condensation protein B
MTLRSRGRGPAARPCRRPAEWFARRSSRGPRSWLAHAVSAESDTASHPILRSPRGARVEAALLVADGPLSARKLVQFARLIDPREARSLVEELNAAYDAAGTAFRVEWVASGFQLLTRPFYAAWLEKLHERRARVKLSPPVMETLVLVAYRQPVTRADVDAIRGVQSAELLRQLLEKGLVRIVGEEETLGRPYLYGTTKSFLESFGLRSLDELPDAAELRRSDDLPESTEPDDGPDEAAA